MSNIAVITRRVIVILTSFLFLLVAVSPTFAAETYDLTQPENFNLRIDGAAVDDRFGFKDIGLYDLNNNGKADLIVPESASIYIIFDDILASHRGPGEIIDLTDSDNYSIRVVGVSLYANYKVTDFDNDGKNDLIAGSSSLDSDGKTNNGEIYLIKNDLLMSKVGEEFNYFDNGNWTYCIKGADDNDYFGSTKEYGDFNGDGLVDLAFSAIRTDYSGTNSGSVYIFNNELISSWSEGSVIQLDDGVTNNFSIRIDGQISDPTSSMGLDRQLALDINGNGKDDLVLSNNLQSYLGRSNAGLVYVIPDDRLPDSGTGNIVSLVDTDNYAVRLIGTEKAYLRVLGKGLFESNGRESIFLQGGYYMGGSFLSSYFDQSGIDLDLAETSSYTGRITLIGWYLLNASADFNGDGREDLMLSDTGADENGTDTGITYIVDNSIFAGISGVGNDLDFISTEDYLFRWLGDNSCLPTYLSQHYYEGGDVNGDGSNDFVFGSDWTDYNGSRSGSVWLVLNFPHTLSVDSVPSRSSNGAVTITGTISAPDSVSNITGVQYSVDDNSDTATWVECSADDGAFDSKSEAFTCAITGLSDGGHTIFIRAYDESGSYTVSTSQVNVVLTVDTMDPLVETGRGVGVATGLGLVLLGVGLCVMSTRKFPETEWAG